nr:MAG TPA: hypothetical protein [Caudoviricetes sp.]
MNLFCILLISGAAPSPIMKERVISVCSVFISCALFSHIRVEKSFPSVAHGLDMAVSISRFATSLNVEYSPLNFCVSYAVL